MILGKKTLAIGSIVLGLCGYGYVITDILSNKDKPLLPTDVDHSRIPLPEVDVIEVDAEIPAQEERPLEADPLDTAPEEPSPNYADSLSVALPTKPKEPVTPPPLDSVTDLMFNKVVRSAPVVPFTPPPAKEEAPVGKLMSPRDLRELEKVNDLLYGRMMTRNWDIVFPVVKKNSVHWRKAAMQLPSGMTSAMVLLDQNENPLVYARGNLVLDSISKTDDLSDHGIPGLNIHPNNHPKTIALEKARQAILRALIMPSSFPPSSITVRIGNKATISSVVRKNRMYLLLPMTLVLDSGPIKGTVAMMLATTDGKSIPDPDRLLPLSMTIAERILTTARASKLLTTQGTLIDTV